MHNYKSLLGPAMVVLALLSGLPQQALAWGHQGHMVVGALADQLLTERARAGLQADLGLALEQAAPWADCVKNVAFGPKGFAYAADERWPSPACTRFETHDGVRAMRDYVARNWDACGQRVDCHKTYHFTDVAYQHLRYRADYVGVNGHDLVHAIRGAVAMLQGKPVPAPFSIASRAEALLLLAHFVGDLHQPLHVGALYLDADAQPVDPDAKGMAADAVFATRGGNSLELGSSNLHAMWDDIPDTLRSSSIPPAMLQDAQALRASRAKPERWVDAWAQDSLAASREVFVGVHFSPASLQKGARVWQASFDDEAGYRTRRERLQIRQLTKAGARLAQLVNALYP